MKITNIISIPAIFDAVKYGERKLKKLTSKYPVEFIQMYQEYKDKLPIETACTIQGTILTSIYEEKLIWSAKPKKDGKNIILKAELSNGVYIVDVNKDTLLAIEEKVKTSKNPYRLFFNNLEMLDKVKNVKKVSIAFPILQYNGEFEINELNKLNFKLARVDKVKQDIDFRLDENGITTKVETTIVLKSYPYKLKPFVFALYKKGNKLPYLIGRVK